MGPTVKNAETCRPGSHLAGLEGETKDGAITQALRERRESKQRGAHAPIRRMRAIAERCAALVGPGASSTEHGELLYDERGLPK